MVDEVVALLMAAIGGQGVVAPMPLSVELVARGTTKRG
jgi:hypothetical protein